MASAYITELINQSVYYIIYLGAVLIPPLFWLVYFRYQDKKRPEPLDILGIVFILGFFSCVVASFFDKWILNFRSVLFIVTPSTLFSILFFASVEEFLKFLVLRYYVYYQSAFDERIDGIIYGITVGLGFATAENIFYIMQNGLEVIVSRFATAMLLHAVLGGFVGYFLSLKKFRFRISELWSLLILILVIILHFIYDLILSIKINFIDHAEVLWIFSLFFILILLIVDTNRKSRIPRLDN